jgi:hypothetical protein
MKLTEEEEQELSEIYQHMRWGCDDWYERSRARVLLDKKKAPEPSIEAAK